MGALRLIHSIAPFLYDRFQPDGMKIEVIVFESPTEAKNAVVTKSVDFAAFGIAAGILGAAAREPVTVVGSCLRPRHGGGGAEGWRASTSWST